MSDLHLSNISAECSVLSAAAYSEAWLLEVIQSLKETDFTRNDTRAVFTVISNMQDRGEKVTLETVVMHEKELAEAGYKKGYGMTISEMIGKPPMAHELPAFISNVKEMTARRAIIRASQMAAQMIERGGMSNEAYTVLENLVMERTATGMTREMLSPQDMGNAIEEAVLERMDEEKKNKVVLYSTFGMLNKYSGGFEKGDLVILSAESGAGKSAFAMNLANGIACKNRRPCLYLNSEMQTRQIALRWAAHLAGVSHSDLRNGSASSEGAQKAIGAGNTMRRGALWTLNMPDMQIASVLAEVRRAKARHNIEMAFVDYIGRMDTMNLKDAKDWQIMRSAAQRLKTLAVDLQITIIMIAQLTSDGGRLAQSSYMSHEADLWLNIGKIKEQDLPQYYPWNYALEFRKARNVENSKIVMLRFDGDTLTFTDKESDAKKMAGQAPAFAGMKIKSATGRDIPQ